MAAHDLVLVTGATGRVGRRLTDRLLGLGARVRTLALPDDPGTGALPDEVDVVVGSLDDQAAVTRAVDGVNRVVHLAALMDWGQDAEHSLYASNVTGTHLLLHELSRRADTVDRVVFASSDEVYPSLLAGEPIVEDRVLAPYSFYGLTKEVGERFALFHHRAHGLPVAVARFSLIAEASEILRADGWSGRLFFASGVRALLTGLGRTDAVAAVDAAVGDQDETLLLPRDAAGEPYRFQFCDVRDLVEGLLCLLDHDAAVGQVFNLSGPAAFGYDEAVPHLAERTGRQYVDLTVPGERFDVRIDIARARELVGYRPRYDVRTIIDAATEEGIATR